MNTLAFGLLVMIAGRHTTTRIVCPKCRYVEPLGG